MREDLAGWVVSGEKRLISAGGERVYRTGHAFLIARGTQWDVVNDPAGQGRYMAQVLALTEDIVKGFIDQHPQFLSTPALQSCSTTPADVRLVDVFRRVEAAAGLSQAILRHRVNEVLLVLAERGLVFAPANALNWAGRVHRLVAQRPHDNWTMARLADAFHLSAGTLRRRLVEEGVTAADCVREVRMELAVGLLQTTTLSIGDVATRCGYESHSRFTAAFRERYGLVPSRLRE